MSGHLLQYARTIIAIILFPLLLTSCAKHGVYLETQKDFNSDLQIGWGPTSVINGKVVGQMVLCVPSKKAMDDGTEANWCSEIRKALEPQE